MSALQQIKAIFDYFFGSDVELRDGHNGTSEVWARRDGDGELWLLAVIDGDESLTDIRLVVSMAGKPVQVDRELTMIGAFDALIRLLEGYVGTGGVISIDRGTGLRAEVDVISHYEDIDFDDDGEPFMVAPPVIARFRFDNAQGTLSAR